MIGNRFAAAAFTLLGAVVGFAPADGDEKNPGKSPALQPRPAWTTSRLHGEPVPPAPYRISPAFPDIQFTKPSSLEEMPDGKRLLVTEIGGKIFTFAKDKKVQQADLVIDLVEQLPADISNRSVSLFHAVLHPRFAENRAMYVCYVHPGEGRHTRVSRFTLTPTSPPTVQQGSEEVIIRWPAGGHNAGCLGFGNDGYLYIATGDGSGPNPPDGLTTGQDVSDLLGAILRIDVDRKAGKQNYTIPADNPFVDRAGVRPEIWSYGLRNPWKFGIDRQTGEMFVADNGWESWEMVHRIQSGGNCGWPIMEGRAVLRSEVKPGPTEIIPPVKDHPHSEANSVIGGPIYRGEKLPALQGSFVYGDYITGTIWGLETDPAAGYSHQTLVDTDLRIVDFVEASGGELYVLDYDFTGQIYELEPSGLPDTSAEFPRQLSETGLFQSLKTMSPAAGVVPYEVQVPRWMDGAEGQRWVAIPEKGRIELAAGADQRSVFPDGTVLVKHLTLPQSGAKSLNLETQILHYENGVWHPYSYQWDDEGADARLVDYSGARRPLQLAGAAERTWHTSAINECRLCHDAGAGFVLGFSANQLSRSVQRVGATFDQLDALAAQRVIQNEVSLDDDSPLRLVDPHDESKDLNDRARSYLHANCSMCHHPRGNAIVSFYLRREMPFEKLNTNKGTGIGTFGMRNAKIIVPGDPFRSVLMYRMSKLGYSRMPYIGSQVIDSDGVALIAEWIRSLPADDTQHASAPTKSSSPEARAVDVLLDKKATRAQQEQAVRTLTQSSEGALALVGHMHAGRLPDAEFQLAVALGRKAPTGDIQGLFETFIPESERKVRLGPHIDPETILGVAGDAGRGKLIFFSDSARCRACHEVGDPDKSLGPTLAEISKKYRRPAELLQHVLQPSLKVEEPVAAYSILTTDGKLVTGLIVEKSDKQIVVKTAEKKLVTIARDEIDELRKSDKSLMPDRILSDLTAQEAADLMAFIRSLAGEASGSEQ